MYTAPQAKSKGAKKEDGVVGTFRYLSPATEPSLRANGKVMTKRDENGSDSTLVGCDFVEVERFVKNARLLTGSARPTVLSTGFEVRNKPFTGGVDFMNHEEVILRYYPQCADAIREATGASFVAAFDHNVRSAVGKSGNTRISGGQQVQGPAHIVHGDYTLTSAEKRVMDMTRPPTANDTLKMVLGSNPLLKEEQVRKSMNGGRWGIINLWRNIADEPVYVNPLAMCEAATVATDDLVVFEIHYADRVGENYFARPKEGHQWYYYPLLKKEEALLLKTWDSAGRLARTQGAESDPGSMSSEPCTFSFHSAFVDPTTPDNAPDRWSIEVRCVVLFDEAPKL
ncbi:hypothetical protein DIPPA_16099 [Diplonema papillatum]|nr:hypothetical protein DIPPA_16099 [Diplonema papillatum]